MNGWVRKRIRGRRTSLALLAASLMHAEVALAQDATKAEANAHFEKGVAAVRMKRLVDAVGEFELAYKISPAFQVLYNIGQVNAAIGRHAEAIRAFTRYLDEGKAGVSSTRRAEVEAEIESQRAFVGTIAIQVFPEGATVTVDGNLAGYSPLTGPIWADAGRHVIQGSLLGYATQLRDAQVSVGSEISIDLSLQPLPPASVDRTSAGQVDASRRAGRQRTIAYALGAGGIAFASTGAILAVTGANKANDAHDRFSTAQTAAAWDTVKADYDSGNSRNMVGFVLIGVGAAGLGVGAFLLATVPKADASSGVHVLPGASSEARGLTLLGTW